MPSSESSSDDGGVELSGAALAALQLHFQEAAQPNSVGGAIHLAAVERTDTYRELFFEEEDDDDRRAAAERLGLRLLHAEPNIYEWRGFLPDADVAFLRELVYGSDPSAFIGSYTQSAAAAEVVTERRTSLLLSSHWWAEGEGQAVWQRMRERLTTALGLSEGCAENPQLVVYPGGAAFFRLHHDSGQWNGEEGEEAEVVLERDQHGAGRLCTAFLYLSTHEGESAVGRRAHLFELEPPAPCLYLCSIGCSCCAGRADAVPRLRRGQGRRGGRRAAGGGAGGRQRRAVVQLRRRAGAGAEGAARGGGLGGAGEHDRGGAG